MFTHIPQLVKEFPDVIDSWGINYLRDVFKSLRDGVTISDKQQEYFEIYYKKIIDIAKKKRYA